MHKFIKTISIILGISGLILISACGSQKHEPVYTEKLILETRNIPEFFMKVIDIIPSSEGELAFKYYSSAEGAENTVLVKYMGGGYEFDSNNFDFIDEIIPLKGKEVVYRGGTAEKQWIFKKHIEIYGGQIVKVKVNLSENIYFLAIEDNKYVLYTEKENKPQKVAEHMIIDDFVFDREENVAYIFKDSIDGGWKLKYKDYTSESYKIIYKYIIDKDNNPVLLARDNNDVLYLVRGDKSLEVKGNYGEFGNLIASSSDGYAFSALNKDNSQWQVITNEDIYTLGGAIRRVKSNKREDIVVSYTATDGQSKLKFLDQETDYDSGQQINDFYLDDYGNLIYIIKGSSGEWQLKINKTSVGSFVRMDRLFPTSDKIYAAGEKSSGELVYIELTYDK